jgi:hypothetical protein
MGGGYGSDGQFHDVPWTGYWFEGASLDSRLPEGTLVAKGWTDQGTYPNNSVNHTQWLAYYESDGTAVLYSASPGQPIKVERLNPDEQWEYHEVDIAAANGPLDPEASSSLIWKIDENTGKPVYFARAVPAPNTWYNNNGLTSNWGNPRYQAGSALSQYVPQRKHKKKKSH